MSRNAAKSRPPDWTAPQPNKPAQRAKRKFLRVFPKGFRDPDYVALERAYKWNAHVAWDEALSKKQFASLIRQRRFHDITAAAVRIESRTNLLFSFEKMALRDAVKGESGAEAFATSLFELLHGKSSMEKRFSSWIDAVARLPRRQTRVLTWPLATVFGFLAQPETHFFFKPKVTKEAARRYGVALPYASRPSWEVYKALLDFVGLVQHDLRDLKPLDMIDIQSFLWVQGSDEYPN